MKDEQIDTKREPNIYLVTGGHGFLVCAFHIWELFGLIIPCRDPMLPAAYSKRG